MKMKTIPLILLATALPLCSYAKLNVVATTAEYGAIAREIGGDHVTVTTLGKPTEDPHFVDAKPSFILKLNLADVLVEGGAELEMGWLPPLLEGGRNPKLDTQPSSAFHHVRTHSHDEVIAARQGDERRGHGDSAAARPNLRQRRAPDPARTGAFFDPVDQFLGVAEAGHGKRK